MIEFLRQSPVRRPLRLHLSPRLGERWPEGSEWGLFAAVSEEAFA
jgi:hypothetical protein